MSFGSRATQAKPEALPSCSEKNYHRYLRACRCVCKRGFPLGSLLFVRLKREAQCGFAISAAIEVDRLARIDLGENQSARASD
jgi:hypothetical protein